ncbi:MAG: 3-dehydroquinate synthase [Thermomicrobiales bacterium]|nr:3-dehydroquinate synthase [Thermomicrobiales bacterium]
MEPLSRIVLVGFSGTGKSTVARRVADLLGWAAFDMDAEIERVWERPIPAIFASEGEAAFRASEREMLRCGLGQDRVVIATGGGAVAEPSAWGDDLLGRPGTLVIALDASPETILARIVEQAAAQGDAVERPMLAGNDPLSRIRQLKETRQAAYDRAHLTLSVDGIPPGEVASEIAMVASLAEGRAFEVRLDAASATSLISIAPDLLEGAGAATRAQWPKARRAWVVTDVNVDHFHGEAMARSLQDAGLDVELQAVAAGEGSKSLATADDLYGWMLRGGIERGDVVVALGGGVVGDLAGFVAATVLRGVGLVQAPTSLLAAVDSSVGGKTGINHAAGKNLIGAFLQPSLVIIDTATLRTLPERELRSGWAEIVKHAIIQRATPGGERGDLATFLERNAARLKRLEEPALSYLIWRNVALKAAVVAADERESGIRAYLNFGHTLGHAIEAADYQHLHGEAVAIGMCAEGELGRLRGTCSAEEAERIRRLVARFDLPMATSVDPGRVRAMMQTDKKRVAGRQRFILPLDGGGVVVRDDVPQTEVDKALAFVNRPMATV